jgi:hypothetical protein
MARRPGSSMLDRYVPCSCWQRQKVVRAFGHNIAKSPPVSEMREVQFAPATEGEVWPNIRSGKYWRPGSQFYGKTKRDHVPGSRANRPRNTLKNAKIQNESLIFKDESYAILEDEHRANTKEELKKDPEVLMT